MVVVAIAGGTGGVGRTVLDAINESGEHSAIVLSRTASSPRAPATTTGANKARRLAVDYDNVEQIKHILQENHVEVVVSAILLADESVAKTQINLIRAAAESGTVTKFIPSEYYIDFHSPIPGSDLFTTFNLEAEAELSRHPQLTWTLIRNGIFLDQLTRPHDPKRTYIDPFWCFVDLEYERCVFPGDGSQPLILSHSTDVAAYIERLIGLPAKDWPRESLIASNKLHVRDLASIIQKATGKKFQVTFDSVDAIKKGLITQLPSNELVFSNPSNGDLFRQVELQVVLSMLSHAHDLPGKNLAELFPIVPTTNIEDFIREAWTLKQSGGLRVAIAGYGDLTRYICDEFVKAGHEILILTRNHKPQLEELGIAQTITDYSLGSLKAPLTNCDVLISTISDISPAYTEVHQNLIRACQESPRCKRFIPAEFTVNIESYPDQPGFYFAPHEPIREMLREQSDLEWTLVCNGWLADYLVPAKNRYIKGIDEFHPMNWAEKKIVIPGTGNEPVDFTWARDVARALASLLKAPRGSWEHYTFMSGVRSCWNDVAKIMEQKYYPGIPVEHRSLHSVAEMMKGAKDENTLMLADYHLLSISHACAMPQEKVQAQRENFFPSVRFRSLEEGLCQYDEYPNSIL